MNVKTPIIGCHHNNKYAMLLTKDENDAKHLLHYFLNGSLGRHY